MADDKELKQAEKLEIKGDLIAQAYQATKGKDDPDWSGVSGQFKEKLGQHAEAVKATGVTQTPFEREYKRLYQEDMANQEDAGPLATDSIPSAGGALDRQGFTDKEAEEANKTVYVDKIEAVDEIPEDAEIDTTTNVVYTGDESELPEPLHAMTRAELNDVAKRHGLNPDDYKNRDEILKAIEAKLT